MQLLQTFYKKTWVSAEAIIDTYCWGLVKEDNPIKNQALKDYSERRIGPEECCRILGFKRYNYYLTTTAPELTGEKLKDRIIEVIKQQAETIDIDYLINVLPATRGNIDYQIRCLLDNNKIYFKEGKMKLVKP